MEGTIVNGYMLKRLLGEGGMAEVWYAENEIGMPAAVKILYDKMTRNEQMLERFHNEAVLMVKLKHPNIRQIYGYGYIGNRHCSIMEYLDGNDLGALMREGRKFTDVELCRWWNQIADALNYTHAQGIVHRDIKPSNLFLDKEGNIKLLDFGIAKMMEDNSMTRTGTLMGTLMYMSPEQVNDTKRVDFHTDLYSLAVTFVHLLTGKAPYDESSSSYLEIPLSIVTKPLNISEVSEEWQDFLKPYLAKDPADRPPLSRFTLFETAVSTPSVQMSDAEAYRQLLEENRQLKERNRQLELLLEELRAKEGKNATINDATEGGETSERIEATVIQVSSNKDDGAVEDAPLVMIQPAELREPMGVKDSQDLKITFAVDNGYGYKASFMMKRIEGGVFYMGATNDPRKENDQNYDALADTDESPVHKVTLDSFYLGQFEVTESLFDCIMGLETTSDSFRAHSNLNWYDCQEIIQKLNALTGRQFRLPTEAEWEYAARGGKFGHSYKYAGSDVADEVAWTAENSDFGLHPVGLKNPNELGLYDMCGSLAEWCEDRYGSYSEDNQTNPYGPSSGSYRVLRGGSWGFVAQRCRVSNREFANNDSRSGCYGLRLALSE